MTTAFKPDFILVDGSSYLFRAFHALPPLTNSAGEPTGAMYGVINMLKKLIQDYPTQYIAVIFDAPGKTFRNDLYSEYKANRGETPKDLIVQIKPLYEIIEAMGLPMIIKEGVEADDVIATLSKKAKQENLKLLISTGDKDLAQLVDENTVLINTMNNKFLNTETVPEKFGVQPNQIVDYLTLMGDNVDNIPGVPGVGPKTAAKWIQQFGSLDELLKHSDEIKGKIGEKLRAAQADLPLSKELIILKEDVDLEKQPSGLTPEEPNTEKLTEFFKRFEFKAWLSEFLKDNQPKTSEHYETILTQADLDKWITKLEKATDIAFDTETSSLDVMQADLIGVSFSIEKDQAAYIPLGHSYLGVPQQLDKGEALEKLRPILTNSEKNIIGQNIKFDMKMMMNEGVQIQPPIFDTQLASYVLNSSSTRHNLDSLALKYLGYQTIHYEDIAGSGAKQIPFSEVPIETASPYAAEDADITLQLHEILWPKVQESEALKKVYLDIEIPLVTVLAKMEFHGVLIDAQKLEQQSKEIATRLAELETEAHKLANKKFNLASTKQLREILYEELELPVLAKTPKGVPSTAEDVLAELAFSYPLPKVILEYRSLSKLKSTYTDSLPKEINPKTGRVHTSYFQTGTSTGRLSSANPNLQNIPIRTEEGRRVRKAFIAPKGYKIISADYSQIELRLMAHLSQDPSLIKAFENDLDIHAATASEVFNSPLEQVSSEQRRSAKAINFGIIYGMSAFGLSKQLGISQKLAKNYINLYFERYPGILKYMKTTKAFAHDKEYVETLFGRRLYLPEINHTNKQRQKAMERAAINAPLQGTAADIIKVAMINMDTFLSQNTVQATMTMQVHDELIFEVAEGDVDFMMGKVRSIMEGAIQLCVPLLVSVNSGDNWDEAH